jgi:predicted ArsR family transcriptional regulator
VGAATVLRCISGGDDAPRDVAGIAAALGVHPNTVRKHLGRLTRDGLVVEETERRGGPGRPARTYRPVPVPPEPYEQLALLLLELRRSPAGAAEVGFAAGVRAASRMPDAVTAVAAVATLHGLTPTIDGDDVLLGTCPFEAALVADAHTVCSLHAGLARGAAALHGADVAVVREGDGCRLHLTRRSP